MKQLTFSLFFLAILFSFACSSGKSPVDPASDVQAKPATDTSSSGNSHQLLSFSYILVDASDPGDIGFEIIPVRDTAKHWNVLKFLEYGPCTTCFKVLGITPSDPPGTIDVEIEISGPFSIPNLTGFDVRGIAMFDANHDFPVSGLNVSDMDFGDGEVLNPDGFTQLYNGTTTGSGPAGLEGYLKGKFATATAPDCLINAYKRFISSDPSNTRNAFLAGDAIAVTYHIKMPASAFVMGYAVDANWTPPTVNPVVDPMTDFPPEANCPEPWKIVASVTGITPFNNASVTIDVYDYQGKTSHSEPVIECPDIFTGTLTVPFLEDGPDYTRYSMDITPSGPITDGDYKCLISVEDNTNDPVGKPWLDLTAYQVVDIAVTLVPDMSEVTPPGLNACTEDYEISGNLLFIGANFNGIQVYDISDPINPFWVRNIPLGYQVWDISISGGYLYAANYSTISFVDIDPIDQASVVGSLNTPPAEFAIASNGTTVYSVGATYPDGELNIIDASDPTTPSEIASLPFPGFPIAVKYLDGYVYVVAADNLHIIDVDPPETPSLVSTVTMTNSAFEVFVEPGYAYVSSYSGLSIVDVDPPESASIVTTVNVSDIAKDSVVKDGYAFVAANSSGIKIVDVDPPAAAFVVDTIPHPCWFKETRLSGNLLVAGAFGTTLVVDITNPLSWSIRSVIDYPGTTFEVAVDGSRLLLANSDSGTLVMDVSAPESPLVTKALDTGPAYAVDIDGNYGYALTYNGLAIIDMTTPGSELVVNIVNFAGSLHDIVVSSGYAYVAAGSYGFMIFDVDPPGSASLLTTVPTSQEARGVDIAGNHAFVAEGNYPNGRISVVDVNPPGSASVVESIDLTAQGYDIKVSGNYAYIANDTADLTVVDITNPVALSLVGSTDLFGSAARGIDLDNNYAFISDYSTGIEAVDISDPLNPVEIGHFTPVGYKMDVDVQGLYAYMACNYGGLRIIRLY